MQAQVIHQDLGKKQLNSNPRKAIVGNQENEEVFEQEAEQVGKYPIPEQLTSNRHEKRQSTECMMGSAASN